MILADQGAGAVFEGWVGGPVQDRRDKMVFCNEACRNGCTGPGNPSSRIFQRLETGFTNAQTTGLAGVVSQDIHITRRARHVKAG